MSDVPKANRGPSAAAGNRRALIAAAREVFGAEGYAAPLNAVAKRAGVGQGSLYRHFPDRVALAVAVFDENIGELEVLAERPGSSLDDLLDLVIAQALVSKALIELITADIGDPRVVPLGDRLQSVIATVVQREKSEGRIRSDVTVDDVALAVSMLASALARVPEERRPETARRAWGLFHSAFAPR
ncbi:TetR family transcriptional regulator [Herbiconiux sp. A18JL235]|uniref:TetR family transcriptional regulator n=1 Tax=Herbiconiux sp. A18JL235 TaxID=3152363 RepID=A0AB39BG27_9MICO